MLCNGEKPGYILGYMGAWLVLEVEVWTFPSIVFCHYSRHPSGSQGGEVVEERYLEQQSMHQDSRGWEAEVQPRPGISRGEQSLL